MPENSGSCKALEVIKTSRHKRTSRCKQKKAGLAEIDESIGKLDRFIQDNVARAFVKAL